MYRRRRMSCTRSWLPQVTVIYVVFTLMSLYGGAWVTADRGSAIGKTCPPVSASAAEVKLPVAAAAAVPADLIGGKQGCEGGSGGGVCKEPAASAESDSANVTAVGHVAAVAPPPPRERPLVLFVSLGLMGHVVPLVRLSEEMIRRGYDAILVSTENVRWVVEGVKGLEFLSLGAMPVSPSNMRAALGRISQQTSGLRGILALLKEVYLPLSLPIYPTLLQLIRVNATYVPDLVVMDIGAAVARDLGSTLGVPLVFNSPTLLFQLEAEPMYMPAWGTGFSVQMSLFERFLNFLFPRLLSFALTGPFITINRLRRDSCLPPLQAQEDLLKGARVLINTAVGLDYARPLPPLITMTGPLLPPAAYAEAKPQMPAIIDNWLRWGTLTNLTQASPSKPASGKGGKSQGGLFSKPQQSSSLSSSTPPSPPQHEQPPPRDLVTTAVYVSMGTMTHLHQKLLQALIEGLTPSEVTGDPLFRVLWMMPKDQMEALPQTLPRHFHVKLLGRLPHVSIVGHESIKAVVSHCGMGTAQEALFFGKPLLCLPHFGDQHDVAQRVADTRAGIVLDKGTLTSAAVKASINELLTNTSYAAHAARVSKQLKGAGGVSTAADVLESALHTGMDHLRTADLSMPWHRAAMLDVYVVCSAVVAMIAALLVLLWGLLMGVMKSLFDSATRLDSRPIRRHGPVDDGVLGTPPGAGGARVGRGGGVGGGGVACRQKEYPVDASTGNGHPHAVGDVVIPAAPKAEQSRGGRGDEDDYDDYEVAGLERSTSSL